MHRLERELGVSLQELQTITLQPGSVLSFLPGFAVSASGSFLAVSSPPSVSSLLPQLCLHACAIISVSWEPEPGAHRTLYVLCDPRSPSRG